MSLLLHRFTVLQALRLSLTRCVEHRRSVGVRVPRGPTCPCVHPPMCPSMCPCVRVSTRRFMCPCVHVCVCRCVDVSMCARVHVSMCPLTLSHTVVCSRDAVPLFDSRCTTVQLEQALRLAWDVRASGVADSSARAAVDSGCGNCTRCWRRLHVVVDPQLHGCVSR